MVIGHVSTNHGLKRNRCCKSTIMCVCILCFLFCITCEDKIAETNTNNCSKKVISFDGIHHTFQSRYVSDSQHRESSLFSRRTSSSARSRDCMGATKRHVHMLSIRLVRKQDMCAILLEVVNKSKLKITSLKHGVHSKAPQIHLQTYCAGSLEMLQVHMKTIN